MNNNLHYVFIDDYTTVSGTQLKAFKLSYQTFGLKLGSAPVVLVNHALTGNSNVAGEQGWWKEIIGSNKAIDTQQYTVTAFNIPGNGFDGFLIDDYQTFTTTDIAHLFLLALNKLHIKQLYAIIGGSLGGGIAWEMASLQTNITKHLISIASDWKATDWLIANCRIQEQFLLNSKEPIQDARMHAMLCYRTPQSFKQRFGRSINESLQIFNVESWLLHHGKKLQGRFQLSAYKMMNHLLKSIEASKGENWADKLSKVKAHIHLIAVDSDLFFIPSENQETQNVLSKKGVTIDYHEIHSIHGHDAFLIEYDQLEKIITPIFETSE